MQNVYFTSDLHFSHMNTLYHHPKKREAAGISLEELQNGDKWEVLTKYDEWLIKKWNETIKREDLVYILGDVCLGNRARTESILKRLNGKKFLIYGNHDKSCKGLERYFIWAGDIKEAKFNHDQFPFIDEGETFCVELLHYPMAAWNRRTHGTCHVHGHCHGSADKMNDESLELRVDVGFDSKMGNLGFVRLEDLYAHFKGIMKKNAPHCKTFQEYAEWLMAKQGFRM